MFSLEFYLNILTIEAYGDRTLVDSFGGVVGITYISQKQEVTTRVIPKNP